MKRTLVAVVVVGLLGGSLVAPVEAKRKRKPQRIERIAEGTYDVPALGVPGVVGSAALGGAVEFPLGPGESFVNIEITDGGGQPVTATLSQDTDTSTPTWEIFATICGKTEEPLAIAPGVALRVSVYTTPGPDQPACTGPATSGTIKATLSNLP